MKLILYKNNINRSIIGILFITGALCACNKIDNFLDEKNNINNVVPATLKDFQSVLDNATVMNSMAYCGIGLRACDNYYLSDANYGLVSEAEQNIYIWADNIWDGGSSYDWDYSYRLIEFANIVLDGLNNIQRTTANKSDYDNIKGEAEFFRSYAYYSLAQAFCRQYSDNSKTDLGLILKQSSDVNETPSRSTLETTYHQIINDFKDAVKLLPASSQYQTRPICPAANAALAKVYLCMSKYDSALVYAKKALTEFNTILDFNDNTLISSTSTYRFPAFPKNPEVMWWATEAPDVATYNYSKSKGTIDSILYNSYSDNDLRKTLYYANSGGGKIQARGCFSGNGYNFCGIATNEILLIKAECEARNADVSDALNDLNTLLAKRYRTGTFQKLVADNADDALRIILTERRKELAFTGQARWEDLRRLNTDPRFAITLKRVVNGKTYTLPPNDPKYVFPIPDVEVQLNGTRQNDR